MHLTMYMPTRYTNATNKRGNYMDQTPRGTTPTSKIPLLSMILGITSIVLAVLYFISVPAAFVAITLGIITLVKRHPGKGKGIAGIVMGGLALFIFIPVSVFLALFVLNNIAEKVEASRTPTSTQTATSSNTNKVTTDCYSYTIPTGYEYDDNSKACHTAVNIPKGDALTRIQVKGTTGTIGTLSDVVNRYNTTLKAADPNTKGIIDQEQFTAGGKTVYYVSYEDTYKLLTGIYIINDPESTQTIGTEPINAYSVLGYTYNAALKGNVRGVVDSLITK